MSEQQNRKKAANTTQQIVKAIKKEFIAIQQQKSD